MIYFIKELCQSLCLCSFSYNYDPTSIPQSKEGTNKAKAAKPPLATVIPENSEMMKPPGRLLCGRSALDMTTTELMDIVIQEECFNPTFFLSISFSWVNLRLHTENQLHMMPGRALKVCVGGGGW